MNPIFRKASAPDPTPFAIVLSRLRELQEFPGLISFVIETGAVRPAGREGLLTDAALRGRLAHFDAHSANEISAVRKALSGQYGRTIVYEAWPDVASCIRFWNGFLGSKIRPVESSCEACGNARSDSVGGAEGESFLRRCDCGRVSRLTISKPIPAAVPAR